MSAFADFNRDINVNTIEAETERAHCMKLKTKLNRKLCHKRLH